MGQSSFRGIALASLSALGLMDEWDYFVTNYRLQIGVT